MKFIHLLLSFHEFCEHYISSISHALQVFAAGPC
jgi:hypothetical protein